MPDVFSQGQFVWAQIPNSNVPRAATVKSVGKEYSVELDGGQLVTVAADKLKPMDPSSREAVSDMIRLVELHEGSLLYNIKQRNKKNQIYTYVGSILISVNPYKALNLYGPGVLREYKNAPIGTKDPHIFAIADEAFRGMLKDRQNQCAIISGESGAGKTEATKLILQYLATLGAKHAQTEERILASSPILEAFGNACTVRNNNSSRFGKYIEIQFNGVGQIEGGRISEFLLEKSRVVNQAPRERNYHSFYCLLVGASSEEKKALKLTSAEKYFYLNQGGMLTVDKLDDLESYTLLKQAYDNLGFAHDIQNDINKILAIILHLGNIKFNKVDGAVEGSSVSEKAALENAAGIMGAPPAVLEKALTRRVSVTKGETFETPLTVSQATDSRDALAKALYGWLFGWLVRNINMKIQNPAYKHTIGVLDIFGFEDFEKNSLEQLFINYANERLQSIFNTHIFKLEQEAYEREGIDWASIKYEDNQPCIDTIAKKPTGVICILDDESMFPKGTDKSFVEKICEAHAKSNYFEPNRKSPMKFIIAHYAGRVTYDSEGFLEKNRDLLRSDLEQVCLESNFPYLSELIISGNESDQAKKAMRQTISSSKPASTAATPTSSAPASPSPTVKGSTSGAGKSKTAGSKFEESLSLLVSILSSCSPHFIRCIKPNKEKKPDIFDDEMVIQQLRYSGILETVRIRKLGYSVRKTFTEFYRLYRFILPTVPAGQEANACKKFFSQLTGKHKDDFQMGKNMVFYRDSFEKDLEHQRHTAQLRLVLIAQRYAKRFVQRMRFKKIRRAVIALQRGFRRRHNKSFSERRETAATKIQSVFRGHRARKLKKHLLVALLSIQNAMRTRLAQAYLLYLRSDKNIKLPAAFKLPDSVGSEPQKIVVIDKKEVKAELENVVNEAIQVTADSSLSQKFEKYLKDAMVVPEIDFLVLDEDIDHCDFPKYVQTYFTVADGDFIDIPIDHPLLASVPDSLENLALTIFQSILIVMGCVKSQGKDQLSALERTSFIINTGIDNEDLRDEIYCQLCKQTFTNPSDEQATIGWSLINTMLSFFPPSETLFRFLIHAVYEFEVVSGTADLLQHKILRSRENDAVRLHPKFEDIVGDALGQKQKLSVHYGSSKSATIEFDPMMTCYEAADTVLMQLEATVVDGWELTIEKNGKYKILKGTSHIIDIVTEMKGGNFAIRKETMDFKETVPDLKMKEIVVEQAVKDLKSRADIDIADACVIMAIYKKALKLNDEELKLIQNLIPKIEIPPPEEFKQILEDAKPEAELGPDENPMDVLIEILSHIPVLFGKRMQIESMTPKSLSSDEEPFEVCIDQNGLHILAEKDQTILISYPLDEVFSAMYEEKSMNFAFNEETIEINTKEPIEEFEAYIELLKEEIYAGFLWGTANIGQLTGKDKHLLQMEVYDVIEVLSEAPDANGWVFARNHSFNPPIEGWARHSSLKPLSSQPTEFPKRKAQPDAKTLQTGSAFDLSEILNPTPVIPGAKSGTMRATGTVRASVIPASVKIPTGDDQGPDPTKPDVPEGEDFDFENPDLYKDIFDWAFKNLRPAEVQNVENFSAISKTIKRLSKMDLSPQKQLSEAERIKNRLKATRTPLTQSMMRLTGEENKVAVGCFILVMQYMGDYPLLGIDHFAVLQQLIMDGLRFNQYIRTEIYCQIWRQLLANRDKKSEKCGWMLLKILSGYFAPSPAFERHFSNWMDGHKSDNNYAFIAEITRTQKNFDVTRNLPRLFGPTEEELVAVETNQPLSIQIQIPGLVPVELQVSPCTLCGDLLNDLANKYGVVDSHMFALTMKFKGLNYIMHHEDYVLDSLQEEFPEVGEKKSLLGNIKKRIAAVGKKKKIEDEAFEITFRKIVWDMQDIPDVPMQLSIMVNEIFDALVPKPKKRDMDRESFVVWSMIAFDMFPAEGCGIKDKENLYLSFLPPGSVAPGEMTKFIDAVDKKIQESNEVTEDDAQVKIVEAAQKWDDYGETVFIVYNAKFGKTNFPRTCQLVLDPNGIKIRDGDKILIQWVHLDVFAWSADVDRITLKFGSMIDRNQQVFIADTSQSRDICHVIGVYNSILEPGEGEDGVPQEITEITGYLQQQKEQAEQKEKEQE